MRILNFPNFQERTKGLEVSLIEATLKELNGDKVPGLDSYTIAF